jgi:hypothetical protein
MTYWKGIGHSWSDCAISLRRFSQGSPYDRKSRLEGVVQALEQERRGLTSYLEAQTLTIEQIEGLRDFATEVCQGLEATDEDFQARRDIVETLDLRASLVVEGGQRGVCSMHHWRRQSAGRVDDFSKWGAQPNTSGLLLTGRLVLNGHSSEQSAW